MIFTGQKIAILGCGISGRAAAKYALQSGAEVRVSDIRSKEEFLGDEGEFLRETGVEWEAGGHTRDFLRWADLIIISPGINPRIALIAELRSDGVNIAGELAVAAGKISVPIVAVTGTNGKTTVTTLIGRLLHGAGKKVFVGGNIGTPLFEYLSDPGDIEVVVVEVSSFQLECSGNFSCDIAVLLNITPDHLDRHGTLEKYIHAKGKLFRNQDKESVAVVNGDDTLCRKLQLGTESEVVYFGTGEDCAAVIAGNTLTVSLGGTVEKYTLGGTSLAGKTGMQNCAAAILAVRALACPPEGIREVLADFHPLPHRLEFVAEIDGISYYNDSKGTNTGAVIAALNHFDSEIVLIAGGRDKGDDYRLLRQSVQERVVKVVVIGEAASLLETALSDIVSVVRAVNMKEAVDIAAQGSGGKVVLLSPACASFDMFESYGHRGEVFIREVLALRRPQSSRLMEKAD